MSRERVGLDVVVEAQRHEVAPLLAPVEPVDGDDALVPALIEGPDDGAPDEAGGAGDEHGPAFKHSQASSSWIQRQVADLADSQTWVN